MRYGPGQETVAGGWVRETRDGSKVLSARVTPESLEALAGLEAGDFLLVIHNDRWMDPFSRGPDYFIVASASGLGPKGEWAESPGGTNGED